MNLDITTDELGLHSLRLLKVLALLMRNYRTARSRIAATSREGGSGSVRERTRASEHLGELLSILRILKLKIRTAAARFKTTSK
jgi:hypothetical protein